MKSGTFSQEAAMALSPYEEVNLLIDRAAARWWP